MQLNPFRPLVLLLVAGALLAPAAAHSADPTAPGTISGTVTLGTTPVPNAGGFVSLYQQTSPGVWQQHDASWGMTDDAGRYSFDAPAGTYRVRFWGPIHYRTEYWNDATTVESAQDVTLVAGTTTAGVDAALGQTDVLPGNPPTVTGTPRVGSALRATSDTWTPTTVTRTRQWFRDGVAVPGAVGPAYTPGASDLGKTLSATVTASATAMAPAAATSTPTAAVALGGLHLTSAARVTGTTAVGRWLLAVPPTTSPTATATYRWLRNGAPITGATKVRYQLRAADRGRKIGVRITLNRAGYRTVVRVVTRPTVTKAG